VAGRERAEHQDRHRRLEPRHRPLAQALRLHARQTHALQKLRRRRTLTVSAVWHGLYPGYYLSFLTAAIVIQVARLGRRVCRPYFVTADDKPKPTKPLYDALTFIGHQFVFNYTMVPFVMLSFTDGIAFWSSLLFSGHILMIAGYVLFTVLGGSRKSAGGAKPTAADVAKTDAKADKVTDMVSKLKHRDTPHPSKAEVRKTAADAASSPYKLRERTPAH
jgi:hypothetical protein